MKTLNLLAKTTSACVIAAVTLLVSCRDEDERLTAQDTQAISEESMTDSYFQDVDDLGSVAVSAPSEDAFTGGRKAATITINDDRMNCQGTTITITPADDSTPDVPKGTIVVDFGTTGCQDARGNIRTGKVIFTYNGRRFQPGSTVITTLDNYTINGIALEGVRTSTNVTGSTTDAPKFNVTLQNGKATFADGTAATRTSDITWKWVRAVNVLQDQLIIDKASTASGTTRGGREYAVSLQEDLVYERGCFIAVDGIKRYVLDGEKTIVIDYGAGDCRSVAVTVNDVTRTVKVY